MNSFKTLKLYLNQLFVCFRLLTVLIAKSHFLYRTEFLMDRENALLILCHHKIFSFSKYFSLSTTQLDTLNACVDFWAVPRILAREKSQSLLSKSQNLILWPSTKCCDFFLSQQVMFSIMKIPNARFFSSPSNNMKAANSPKSEYF